MPVDTCSGKWEINGYRSLPTGASWASEWALFYLRIDPLAQAAFLDGNPVALRYVDFFAEKDFRNSNFFVIFSLEFPRRFRFFFL